MSDLGLRTQSAGEKREELSQQVPQGTMDVQFSIRHRLIIID